MSSITILSIKDYRNPYEFMGIRGKFIYYAAGTFLLGFIGFLMFNILLGFFSGAVALSCHFRYRNHHHFIKQSLDYMQRNVTKV